MSKIGKQPVNIPDKVTVQLKQGVVVVKGPKGELQREFPEKHLDFILENQQIIIKPKDQSDKGRALWGTWRKLVANMVEGVTNGFEKRLKLEGVGYKAALQGKKLVLSLGFSHPVEIETPDGITFKVEKNIIIVSGINKELVGQTAADIRNWRKPEPYKGKGIRYEGEVVRRKAGKKAVASNT